jgi:hypothetical protein
LDASGSVVAREGAVREVLDGGLSKIRNGLLECSGGPFGYEAIEMVAEPPPEAAVPERPQSQKALTVKLISLS